MAKRDHGLLEYRKAGGRASGRSHRGSRRELGKSRRGGSRRAWRSALRHRPRAQSILVAE